MEKTEKTQTLLKIQQALNVPKSQYNSFGKYNYRNCEDILEAVKPLLAEYKATLIIGDEPILIGAWVFVKATAVLQDSEGGEWRTTAVAKHATEQKGMQDSQLTGSTSSYARKYALNGLFAIDDAKDADTQDNTVSAEKAPQKPLQTAPEASNPEGETLGICPKCKGGQIVERTAKTTGKKFWGCSAFPSCDYVSWTKPEVTE